MPDAATILAAKPKCPAGPDQDKRFGLIHAQEPCRRPLRYSHTAEMWMCPVHGAVTTRQSLVSRQR